MNRRAAIPLLAFALLWMGTWEASSIKADSGHDLREKEKAARQQEFRQQWELVKAEYPIVAVELLKRQAFAAQLTQLALDDSVEPERLATHAIICSVYDRFGYERPRECLPPIGGGEGDIAECFDPKPGADGAYGMPTPPEVENCLQGKGFDPEASEW